MTRLAVGAPPETVSGRWVAPTHNLASAADHAPAIPAVKSAIIRPTVAAILATKRYVKIRTIEIQAGFLIAITPFTE